MKVYRRVECAVFYKTTEPFGALSNMAAGFPLMIEGRRVLTVEALYQACRYPHRPDIQHEILAQTSPIAAKMKSKHYYALTRTDWDVVRVPIMAWCLRLKLTQHGTRFEQELMATGTRPIVEASYRDRFWAAVSLDTERLAGANVLGCLLMAMRDRLRRGDGAALREATPPGIDAFYLEGRAIAPVMLIAPQAAAAAR